MRLAVPDTNFWLHVRRPYPFSRLVDSDDFAVVVPYEVLRELDDAKRAQDRQTRKRAREVLADLRTLIRATTQQADPLEATHPDGTRYQFVRPTGTQVGDEAIATAASSLQRSGDVVLLTSDGGMELCARTLGVPVIPVPFDLLEDPQQDPLEQRVTELERQLKLQPLQVWVEVERLFPQGPSLELERLDLPTEAEFASLHQTIVDGMSNRRADVVMPRPLADYHAQLPKFADKAVSFLRRRARAESLGRAAIHFQLLLTNQTTMPMESVVLQLAAPDGVTFEFPPSFPTAPKPPQPPTSPAEQALLGGGGLTALQRSIARLGSIPQLPIPKPPPATWAPRISRGIREIEITLHEPLRPDFPTFAGKLWLALEPEFPDKPIDLQYAIYAASRAKPRSGRFSLDVFHRHQPWAAPPLPSHLDPRWKFPEARTQLDLYDRLPA